MNQVTIDIAKQYLTFSAGHFTIFSATERENLHGHNWRLAAAVTAAVGDDGLCFDYGCLKQLLKRECDALDERMLLPGRSPYLEVTEAHGRVQARFGDEVMSFLARDALVLPVRNITVEELAGWFGERIRDADDLTHVALTRLRVRVSSGTDQWAEAEIIPT